jgi:crossover junction endodeoxyribonuclease RuvC
MNKERTILGIDPGTGKCGYAVLGLKIVNCKLKIPKSCKLLDCGCIETKANTPLPDRLEIIFNKICALIKKYKVNEMAIEELFFVKNIKTGISVAQARGVIMLAAAQGGAEISEYKPNEVKLAITGYGHATKEQMAKMLKLHLRDCDIKQDDTADAIAIALHHLHFCKHPKSPESFFELSPKRESKILYPELSYKIVGALYSCFNHLGPGLQERYYQSLMREELKKISVNFHDQKKLAIKGLPSYLGRFFPDFLIENKVILELKVGHRIKKSDVDQVMAYLRQSGKELAIIALFGQNGVVTRRLLLGFSGADSGY